MAALFIALVFAGGYVILAAIQEVTEWVSRRIDDHEWFEEEQ